MEKKHISAIVVAAGNSTRMGGKTPKILMELCGKPVILYSLEAFEYSLYIDEIILVCREENISDLKNLSCNIKKLKKIVIGGDTRQKSVLNGIKCTDSKTDYFLIHDGARPLISQQEIENVIEDALKYSAATLSIKIKDTVKLSDGKGFIESTLQRDLLYSVQTPQVFERKLYEKALEMAENDNYTDDCALIENIGGKVYLSEGKNSNIKITTPEDIIIAKAFLKGGSEEC